MPAYEWNFGDVNPPVYAFAAMYAYIAEKNANGKGDTEFLKAVFQKLLLNFSWWANRKDPQGRNIFEGGFSASIGLRPNREVPVRSPLEGSHSVLRIFSWRRWQGRRRQSSDRLDRARRALHTGPPHGREEDFGIGNPSDSSTGNSQEPSCG